MGMLHIINYTYETLLYSSWFLIHFNHGIYQLAISTSVFENQNIEIWQFLLEVSYQIRTSTYLFQSICWVTIDPSSNFLLDDLCKKKIIATTSVKLLSFCNNTFNCNTHSEIIFCNNNTFKIWMAFPIIVMIIDDVEINPEWGYWKVIQPYD